MDNSVSSIVIDNGTGTCKAGYAGDHSPRFVLPSLVGRSRDGSGNGLENQATYVGDEAQKKRRILQLSNPMEKGRIKNWDDMEKIWNHIFSSGLNVSPEDHPVVLTDRPLTSTADREKMFQILFETFNLPASYVAIQAVLALYATGRLAGMVIDSGEGTTHVAPISEGFMLPQATLEFDLAGKDLTEYLAKLLSQKEGFAAASDSLESAKNIKEQFGYVALTFDQENAAALENTSLSKSYTLPDGQNVIVGKERFHCTEAFFQPNLVGSSSPGIHKIVKNSLDKCEDLGEAIYGSILLAGGSTIFPGMQKRLQKEVRNLFPPSAKRNAVNVMESTQGTNTVWIGGSLLAALPQFKEMWVSKKEYDETGPSIVGKKCY